jgi:DNA primase
VTLSPAFLDELRDRTTLSTLVGKSVKLTKAGREYKACCPFHHEKTPSFYVNDEKGFYHCFGCQAHGDAIRFLTDARGLPFMDAVKELADAAGLELPAPDPRAAAKAERAKDLYGVMEAAQLWFEEQLGAIEGSAARAYLDQRRISADTRRRFGFGFGPNARGRLRQALKEFGDEMLVEAGLLVRPDEGGREPYDRFRGRLTFPIRDRRGRVIAFSARIWGGAPKYLNPPTRRCSTRPHPVQHRPRGPASRDRRRVWWSRADGRDRARPGGIGERSRRSAPPYRDASSLCCGGLRPAPILLRRRFGGEKAADAGDVRCPCRADAADFVSLRTLPPAGSDDLIRARARGAMRRCRTAEPLVDRLWRHELESEPLTTPEAKAGLKRRLLDRADSIRDPDVRDQYRGELLRRFDEVARPPRREFTPAAGGGARQPWQRGRFGAPPPRPTTDAARALGSTGLSPAIARAVLDGLMRHPQLIGDHAEAIAALPIPAGELARARDRMLEMALAHDPLDREGLLTILAGGGAAAALERPSRGYGLFCFNRIDADPERAQRDLVLAVDTLAARPELDAAYAAATVRLAEAFDEATFDEQKRLKAALAELDETCQGWSGRADGNGIGERMAKTETSESEERTEGGDAPLIDLNEADLKKLISRAKKRGYITVDELNGAVGEMNTDQIEDVMSALNEMGVNVVEAERNPTTMSRQGRGSVRRRRQRRRRDLRHREEEGDRRSHGRSGPHVSARDGGGGAPVARRRDRDRQADRGRPRHDDLGALRKPDHLQRDHRLVRRAQSRRHAAARDPRPRGDAVQGTDARAGRGRRERG